MKIQNESYLAHYGTKGQKWGVRRYQNEDGSLTEEGKRRYYRSDGTLTRKGIREYQNPDYSPEQRKRDISVYGKRAEKRINKQLNKGNMISGARSLEAKRVARNEKTKKIIKKAGPIALPIIAAGAAYGIDYLHNYNAQSKMYKMFDGEAMKNKENRKAARVYAFNKVNNDVKNILKRRKQNG